MSRKVLTRIEEQMCVCVCGLTVDVQTRGAGHDPGFVLGGHRVPASVFLQGWLDDHTQVATVVLVHAGKEQGPVREQRAEGGGGPISKHLPDSVCVLSQALVLPFPEDLRVGNPGDATLQAHGVTLGHAGVLQLLHEHRHLVHLFGCRGGGGGEEHVNQCFT